MTSLGLTCSLAMEDPRKVCLLFSLLSRLFPSFTFSSSSFSLSLYLLITRVYLRLQIDRFGRDLRTRTHRRQARALRSLDANGRRKHSKFFRRFREIEKFRSPSAGKLVHTNHRRSHES